MITIEKGETHSQVTKPTGVVEQTEGTTKPVPTDGSSVGLTMGHTKNLGNYESVKFEVSVRVPCTMQTVDAAFDLCNKWSDDKLTGLIEEVDKELNGDT